MAQDSTPARYGLGWKVCFVGVLFSFIILLQGYIARLPAIQIGGDEGFELAKAEVRLHGFALYSEIWNDQPPLHTIVTSALLTYISPSISGPRLASVLLSATLLMAVLFAAQRISGLLAAVLTIILLSLAPGFLLLGSSCMLEIPALAPAVGALALLLCAPWRHFSVTNIAAGGLFGTALLTKLLPAILLPGALLIIGLRTWGPSKFSLSYKGRSFVKSVAVMLFATGATFVALDMVLEHCGFLLHLNQTWTSHFGGSKTIEYGSAKDFSFDWSVLVKHWDASFPGLMGVVVSLTRICRTDEIYPAPNNHKWKINEQSLKRSQFQSLPAVWLIYSLLLFGLHRPWWSYYYVHTAIPLCWCAGIGLAWVWERVCSGSGNLTSPERGWVAGPNRGESSWQTARKGRARASVNVRWPVSRLLAAALLTAYALVTTAWAGARAYFQVQSVRNSEQIANSLVLAEMARYKPYTKWLYTDDPIYSFHSGIPLPPDLAVVMLKRLWSGEMTSARLANEVREYCPGLILLRTGSDRAPFQDFLESDYRLVYYDDAHRLYAHKSISNKPPL